MIPKNFGLFILKFVLVRDRGTGVVFLILNMVIILGWRRLIFSVGLADLGRRVCSATRRSLGRDSSPRRSDTRSEEPVPISHQE